MESYCRDGRGRIYVLRFGDEVAAACLAVIADGTAYLLKTTHNEAAAKRGARDVPQAPLHRVALQPRART